ncbi:MAG TPA: clostripain-related cysteine peptidase [Thermoanaerobaculia bacterium]|nr:clostripain-related cysteine peptidase [Thermoanaerobaculia bacterium]
MPIQLKAKCHGIGPFVAAPNDKHAAVFLCQAPEKVVPNQLTYVRFRRANYSDSNRRPVEGDPLSDFGHVILNRERLSIVAAVAQSDAELRIDRYKDPTSSTPTRRDSRSLHWLPKTEQLAPGHGALKSDYFTDPVNVEPRLIARVDFAQGRLGTTGVANIQVPFRSTKESMTMPMARDIQVELTIESDHFVLRSDPFEGTRDPANDLHFKGEGEVEIVIGNEPEGDMELGTPPILPIDVINQAAALEWRFYFSLCENQPTDPLLPHLARRPGSQTGCSRPEYNPSGSLTASVSSFNREALPLRRAVDSDTPQSPKWSLLAYLAFDNDLRNVGRLNVAQIEKADPSKVGVVVLLDVPEAGTRRLVLGNDGLEPISEAEENVDAGDPKTLTDFLITAKRVCPSEYAAVVIASHGSGLRDVIPTRGRRRRSVLDISHFSERFANNLSARLKNIFFQPTSTEEEVAAVEPVKHQELQREPRELVLARGARLPELDLEDPELRKIPMHTLAVSFDVSAGDALDNQELEQGLHDALGSEGPFDILAFDACLMCLVEIGYQLRLCAKYMVASQEDLTSGGWPYTEVLNSLGSGIAPRDAAMAIVDVFASSHQESGATLSAIDLNSMTPLMRALDDLGGALLGKVPNLIGPLAQAREKARTFADFDYVDLYGFAHALEEELGKAMPAGRDRDRVLAAAKAVYQEVEKAVLKTSETKVASGKPKPHGLSVYVPNAPVIAEYHTLSISADAQRWHNFVVEYGDNR